MNHFQSTKIQLVWFVLFTLVMISNADWRVTGPGAGSDLHFMAVQPDNPDVIYVGGDIEGIFKTTDGGESWTNINNNLATAPYGGGKYWINDIVIHPVDYQKVYLCTGIGLFLSENAGQTWQLLFPKQMETEDDPVSVSTVAVFPGNPDRLYLGFGDPSHGSFADFAPFQNSEESGDLYFSGNGGSTWSSISGAVPDGAVVHNIVADADNLDRVLIATSRGLFGTGDGGDSWTLKNIGLPHNNCHRLEAIRFEDKTVLYLTVKVLGTSGDPDSFEGGIFKSIDFGESWQDLTSDLPKYDAEDAIFYDYWKFAVNPKNPKTIYIGTVRGSGYEEPGIYKTQNGGKSWEYIHFPGEDGWMDSDWFWEPYVFDIKVSPSDTSMVIYCLDWVTISPDGGDTWSQVYTKKVDGGWQGTGLGLMNTETITFHPSNPEVFWVGYDDMGLFRSDNGGLSYLRLDPAMDPDIDDLTDVDAVHAIWVDPGNLDLYINRDQGSQGGHDAGYTSSGIVKSRNLGDDVTSISSGLPRGRNDLACDFSTGEPGNRTLYSAVYHHGVYKSTNSGASWTAMNAGLGENAASVWQIALHPDLPDFLLLGMNRFGESGGNVYVSKNGGIEWTRLNTAPAGDVLMIEIHASKGLFLSVTDNFEWNYSGGLYHSSDLGESWIKLHDHPRVIAMDFHPQNPDNLIIAGQEWYKPDKYGGLVAYSENGGTTWQDITLTIGHTFFNDVRLNPHRPTQIYACTAGGGLWVTDLKESQVNNSPVEPLTCMLEQNFPNPFNPKTTINYHVTAPGHVRLIITNHLGQKVAELVNKQQPTGRHSVKFNADALSTGVYFYQLTTPDQIETRKMLLLR